MVSELLASVHRVLVIGQLLFAVGFTIHSSVVVFVLIWLSQFTLFHEQRPSLHSQVVILIIFS